ncbi:Ankyrin repeat protein [Giardia duodenalis]|uniref:Protein 21.1 n=2 Tax=Giardia intestinalis TaxID=5741 RepID=C6LSJ3_GIAIB|nr:Protein 21.1 [Giardia intestinalis ATCC 50581]ESU43288.1 Ankyrin repeat protein [Giardia intestinalis]
MELKMLLDGSARRSDVDASAEPAVKRLFSDGETVLMQAAGRKNVVEVEKHLDECEKRGINDRTALMIAAKNGHKEVLEVLLEREKGMRDNEGMTALIHAAMNGHKGVVEILLKHERGMRDKQGHNALYYALRNRHTATARVILPFEDPTDCNGVTALMRATARGDVEMVGLLAPLQKGMKDKRRNTAFIHALTNKLTNIALLLREYETPSWTPLMCAAFTGDIEIAKSHLSDKDKKNNNGDTALMIAARAGHKNIVELLDPTDKNGVTALMRAAERGDVEAVRALIPLQKGRQTLRKVNINGVWIFRRGTALMWAAAYGHAEVVKLLMEHEGGIQASGWSALMFAAQCSRSNERHGESFVDYPKCVKLLMEREGKISGWTALMYAAARGHERVVELLVEHQGGIQNNSHQTALMWAARNGHLECVKLLLEKEGCMQNDRGWTALMNAAWGGHLECVRLLAEKEKRLQNIDGKTARIIASRRGHSSVADLLATYE